MIWVRRIFGTLFLVVLLIVLWPHIGHGLIAFALLVPILLLLLWIKKRYGVTWL